MKNADAPAREARGGGGNVIIPVYVSDTVAIIATGFDPSGNQVNIVENIGSGDENRSGPRWGAGSRTRDKLSLVQFGAP